MKGHLSYLIRSFGHFDLTSSPASPEYLCLLVQEREEQAERVAVLEFLGTGRLYLGEKWQIADGIPPFVRARDVPDAGRLLFFFSLSSFLSSLSCWSDDAQAVVKREPYVSAIGALFFFVCA